MLELRPTCEHCNRAVPPDSLEARICSYECIILRGLCRGRSGKCLSELRRWICSSTDQTFDELERRQLPRERSGWQQGQASAGGFAGA